jgi:hypothetical protein
MPKIQLTQKFSDNPVPRIYSILSEIIDNFSFIHYGFRDSTNHDFLT